MPHELYTDLHIHLDGAITPEIAKKLSDIQDITLPTTVDDELESLLSVPTDCRDLNDFLKCFDLPLTLLQTYEGLSEVAFLISEKMYSEGVIYTEIRYAPALHTKKSLSQEDAVNAVIDGVKKSSLHANIILCLMRGSDNTSANLETLELARKYLVDDGGVVAIDLAGAEGLYPTRDYGEIFKKAVKYDIPFTIHAGEAAGPDSVREAISFGASRIGHGVRAIEDSSLIDIIIKKQIPLEMCPTSNLQTHTIDDIHNYPIRDYLDAGVLVTINTDDPAIERTTISREFDLIADVFDLTDEQIFTLKMNSINSAFTTETVKTELRKMVKNQTTLF